MKNKMFKRLIAIVRSTRSFQIFIATTIFDKFFPRMRERCWKIFNAGNNVVRKHDKPSYL